MEENRGKHVNLSIDDPDRLYRYVHALDSPVRISIIRALGEKSMNIGELAQRLDIPMSSAALAVKMLEEAGLIMSEMQPGTRGAMKICSRKTDTLAVTLMPEERNDANVLMLQMPVGGYSSAEGIMPTCGIVGDNAYICDMDDPNGFYVTGRFAAQLIWFRQGMLEYRFSWPQMSMMEIDWLEVSFEACSEAPMHRDPWKSDISVAVNAKTLGSWTSPCDCGGRHGRQTPDWWPETNTQFGFLKAWRVTHEGSFVENERVGDTTIADLALEMQDYIAVGIGVAKDAQNVGGINLFGEHFGDHPQGIILRIGYRLKNIKDNNSK